jgi:hypothetical protein
VHHSTNVSSINDDFEEYVHLGHVVFKHVKYLYVEAKERSPTDCGDGGT